MKNSKQESQQQKKTKRRVRHAAGKFSLFGGNFIRNNNKQNKQNVLPEVQAAPQQRYILVHTIHTNCVGDKCKENQEKCAMAGRCQSAAAAATN